MESSGKHGPKALRTARHVSKWSQADHPRTPTAERADRDKAPLRQQAEWWERRALRLSASAAICTPVGFYWRKNMPPAEKEKDPEAV